MLLVIAARFEVEALIQSSRMASCMECKVCLLLFGKYATILSGGESERAEGATAPHPTFKSGGTVPPPPTIVE